ncbi:MAG: serine/threonine-protein kinase [Thermomicrobiales bacterium]
MSSDFALSILNNKYVLTRLLGNGGFGEVYEAYDPRLGTHYAVKIVHCETEEKRRQVTREAKLLAQHSKKLRFIPDVYDVWPDGQKTNLVMEFIDGPTLQARLEQSPQPWPADRVELFLRILLRHLDQLHDAGIVHRDLKPSNIKDHPERGYILLDFGIAKQSETYTFAKEVGTIEYAPLEQLTQGGSTDQRSDLYSLGATAYQLLTRQLPIPPHLRHAARHNGQGEILIPPGRLVAGVPPALERTLLALLGLDPTERPANARAALALLDGSTTDTVISPPTPKRPTPPPRCLAAAIVNQRRDDRRAAPGAARRDPGPCRWRLPRCPHPPRPANGQAQVALPRDPRRTLVRRAAAWWRDLWQPASSTTLIFTGLWVAVGVLIGWGAGWGVMLAAAAGRTLLFPFFGATVGAIICCLAWLLAVPKGHATGARCRCRRDLRRGDGARRRARRRPLHHHRPQSGQSGRHGDARRGLRPVPRGDRRALAPHPPRSDPRRAPARRHRHRVHRVQRGVGRHRPRRGHRQPALAAHPRLCGQPPQRLPGARRAGRRPRRRCHRPVPRLRHASPARRVTNGGFKVPSSRFEGHDPNLEPGTWNCGPSPPSLPAHSAPPTRDRCTN